MKDVEYEVSNHAHNRIGTYPTFAEAATVALGAAASNGRAVTLDVLVWSKAGARRLGGDDAVAQYLEDPDASVFERLEIKVNNVGRVP